MLDHHALRAGLPAGGRQQRFAGAVGRRCGAGHPVVPHARQQRAGDGEVELERRQPTGHQLRSLGDPRLRVPVDEPVVRGPLQPGRVHVARAERHRCRARKPARDAQPHARLVVRPRLQGDDLQRPGVQLRPRRGGERPGARERSGRRHRRRAARVPVARQRKPVLTVRRDRAGDEHVPLAAHPGELLWAMRRRRLRHVGDRARVHAPDLEPHGRGPQRKPLGRPGRRHGRELVRPLRCRVPQLAGARPAWRREPVRRRPVRDRRQGGGDP